jgi:CBS domain-containing protein
MTSARGNEYLNKNPGKTFTILVKAKDLARELITLDSNKTLLDARNFMLRYDISRVIISLNGKIAGIITEKDIAGFLYNTPPIRRISEIALKELIHKKLVTVRENMTIENCAKLMLKHRISSVIVIDYNGKDVGIITKSDMIEQHAYRQPTHVLVNEFMSKKVQSVAPDETIHTTAMLMATYKISRIVVKKKSKPVGIITSRDFLPTSYFYDTGSQRRISKTGREIRFAKSYQKFIPSGFMGFILAQEVMSHPVITVSMNANIAEAAKLMIRNNISGLPVINQKQDLLGIITKTDILKSMMVNEESIK